MMSNGGYTNENDIIAEEAYVRGYLDRVANYVTSPRAQRVRRSRKARHPDEIAERNMKYGEGDFDWGHL